jgi:mono/diheme cytochrome c family protein
MPTPFVCKEVAMERWFWILLVTVLLGGCQDPRAEYPRQTPPADFGSARALQNGEELFLRLCASCHGHRAEGRSPRADFFSPAAPDFSASKYAAIDPAYLYWRIARGKTVEPYLSQGSVMPTWEQHFSPPQIWSLVAYLRSRSR